MFGFGLKSKAKRVIREEFFYEVSYINKPTFNAIYQQGKMIGQNEYSIAIFYMFVMMNVLLENINFLSDNENAGMNISMFWRPGAQYLELCQLFQFLLDLVAKTSNFLDNSISQCFGGLELQSKSFLFQSKSF